MMSVPANAYVFRNSSIKVGATDFANCFAKSRLVPDTAIQTLKTLVPDGIVQDVDITTWTWEVTGVQDWLAATGLASILTAANGTQLTITLVPKVGTGNPQATFTIISVPVDFGGDQGAFNTFDQTFAVIGQPTFGTAP
jgi:hypothetical protein